MALTPGSRLGPYEVLSPIGAGGMGEVYRARDTTLNRDVAIKVLPEELAADPERVARFEREAQVLASLNHPNIASIYGFESSALVLELVEGPTLAERVGQGPIAIDDAIAIAKQIAEALEAGHEAGVIHRDLKPANVKVKEDGTVKVLDYGLAKALEDEGPMGADSELSQSPTLTRQGTQVGVILGTAAYMSPEQAKGKRVDRRADIWAFGAVVYEMLTGKRAFAGEDVSDTLAAVLRAEPDLDALPAETPESLRLVLRLGLSKNVTERFQSIGDVRLALDGSFDTGAPESTALEGQRIAWPAVAGALIAAALVGALVTSIVGFRRPEPPRPLARFVLDSSLVLHESGVAISPDGTRIAYGSMTSGSDQLVVRALDAFEATPLSDATGSRPFFSPDGSWVGYQDENSLRKVSVIGGPSTPLAQGFASLPRGGSWGDDDTIVFGTQGLSGLWRVPADGGDPQELTPPDAALQNYDQPQILPGADAVLCSINSVNVIAPGGESTWIVVQSLVSGETKKLVPGGTNPRYAATGHIVYSVGTTLFAVGFDADELELTTDPVPVVDGIVISSFGHASFDISTGGSLAYVAGRSESDAGYTLVWVDRTGKEEALAAEPRNYTYPRISPDGTRLALDVRDQEFDIWIWDFARETLTRLTFESGPDFYPAWTPDGARVAFGSSRDSTVAQLFWKAADGTGAAESLTESETLLFPQTFSRDGAFLVFREHSPSEGVNLGMRSMDADGTIEMLLTSEFNEQNAEISPDGNWVAFDSNASGQLEVYVHPFPNVDEGRWQISQGGGSQPLWGPDGRELFYLSPSGLLTVVPIQMDPFAPGNPEVVLEQRYVSRAGGAAQGRAYDISSDGKRFLMIKEGARDEETEPTQLILVQNWFDELQRLVPVEH